MALSPVPRSSGRSRVPGRAGRSLVVASALALLVVAPSAGAVRHQEPEVRPIPAAASWCSSEVGLPSWSVPGDYIVRDNFESGDLSNWLTVDEGDAWAGVTNEFAKTGLCSGQLIVTSSSTSRANIQKKLPSGTTDVWALGRFRVRADGWSGSNVPTFRFFDGSSRILDVYRQNHVGELWLRTARGDGSWNFVKLNRQMALNLWYRVAIHVHTRWDQSEVAVYVSGDLVYRNTAYYLPSGRLTTAMIGAEHFRQEMDMVFDNVVVKAS